MVVFNMIGYLCGASSRCEMEASVWLPVMPYLEFKRNLDDTFGVPFFMIRRLMRLI